MHNNGGKMKIDERGFVANKEGQWVHPDLVPADKKLEDELVGKLITGAHRVHEVVKEFKNNSFEECYGYVELLRQNYNLDRMEKSSSGSVTLKSYDGSQEVIISVQKIISFDQKLSLAKEKIDEYLEMKTKNSDAEIRTIITRAFDIKGGKVDTKQILSLKQYEITHPKWIEAMKMIDDATEIAGTKSYIRFRERDEAGEMKTIILDFAAIPIEKKRR
jgi:hypothetical protein